MVWYNLRIVQNIKSERIELVYINSDLFRFFLFGWIKRPYCASSLYGNHQISSELLTRHDQFDHTSIPHILFGYKIFGDTAGTSDGGSNTG